MNYLIRTSIESDLDKLIDLCQKHAAYERASYHLQGKKENLKKALFSEEKVLNCLIVEVSGEIIGYATYTFDFSTWDAEKFIYLDCLYLEDDFRSYGIGQALIEKIEEIGKSQNCINMQWQTPDFNVRAIKFYNRIGASGKEKIRFTLPLK
ncbi:GNAT family N-acetyltransferase [Chryseobacterium sp. ERMR1:04]|uniref:GNAT family N-acetyltransferase n=1 Tax=Chryseobacterium sp. ERMR1:04 TaxID=1705393 RepID=UPI0006C8BC38|nr:GNAT family N-acetyltransferase [Chryseobacterium sp. ERMR1:04]KPH14413.1 GCN5 family acetyltransferase [Chryseobacterium sp. ERMR1:04]